MPPFDAKSKQEVFRTVSELKVAWDRLPADCSPELRDLLSLFLKVNPAERLGYNGIQEIKDHPWFQSVQWDHHKDTIPPFIPNPIDESSDEYFQRNAFTSSLLVGTDEDEDTHFDTLNFVNVGLHSNKEVAELEKLNLELASRI